MTYNVSSGTLSLYTTTTTDLLMSFSDSYTQAIICYVFGHG